MLDELERQLDAERPEKARHAGRPHVDLARNAALAEEGVEQALRVLKRGEDTQDIKTVVSFNDVLYMYSSDIMSERYAKALADGNEAGEADF